MQVVRAANSAFLSKQLPVSIKRTLSHFQSAMKIGVVQRTSTADKLDNVQKTTQLISKCLNEGAKMIFLPEAFDFISTNSQELFDLAEPVDGPVVTTYRNLARKEKVWLSLGGFHKKLTDEPRVANTHLIIDDKGDIVANYEKIHLYDVDIPNKLRMLESKVVRPGSSLPPVVSTPVGQVGLGICYDMRFPELAMGLREAGADLLTYPSAFSVPTGEAGHWETLLRARAIENQCWVVAAALCGRHNANRASYGHSLVVNPWGEVVCDLGLDEGAVTIEIENKVTATVRANMPMDKHRQHGVYPSVTMQPRRPDRLQAFKFGEHRIAGEHVFLVSNQCFAFVNLRPVVPGHVLVATQHPKERLSELNAGELCDLYRVVHFVASVIEAQFGGSALTVACQDGPAAGQTVPHVHIHVLPRREGDFSNNDQIYDELEGRIDSRRENRSHEEMSVEAELLCQRIFSESAS